ncbi:hypothetical protein [Pseudoxanthomonas winnipegensis]|uniref:Peptidase M61 catalytic domain-containing protein n=1 Tax=Pseudoxanthomonas winnipegensis TaxID=2480810 RepID=A0A4Q8LU35_9GAMM|nr:hypothetical protein [Pseudoxanthomonas winnipegensis]RZZ88257.1 hypothetical protein EA663_05305 [Pseudoxanthomonas winnipegensis]TAA34543.1 hypothetical protein EA656_12550 [Pseudoxanthomonas winnipegensis]
MPSHALAGALTLLSLVSSQPRLDASTRYELSAETDDGRITALAVTIRLQADPSGRTVIDWAEQWAGEEHLGQWARDISVEGARRTAVAPHGGRIVDSAPGAPLVMRYRIVSAHQAAPAVSNSRQPDPIVRPDWFYAVGFSLYAQPAGREDLPATFTWRGPHGIGFASDAQHLQGLMHQPRTGKDIRESVAIGGRDLRVSTMRVGGEPLRVASIGRFGFDMAAFARLAGKVIASERAFWGDDQAGPFLITAIPLASEPKQTGFSGTGLGDAFATWIGQDTPLPDLAWFLAHEYFHSWNPRQLGHTEDATEARTYWISEGFTDFFARRLMLRAGMLSPERFVEEWNEVLAHYARSPYRTSSNAVVADRFWKDERARMMPYQRGALLAAIWDRRLRQRSGGRTSLDDVLQDQRRRAQADPALALQDALVAAAAHAGLDLRPEISRYVDHAAPVLLPEDAFGECARVVSVDTPVFDRGWDTEATTRQGEVVTGLDPASTAYAAGLRNGMKLLSQSGGNPADPQVEITLVAQDASGQHRLRFRPLGRETVRLQRIALNAARFSARPEACRQALAG